MLCEISTYGGFLSTWAAVASIAFVATGALSAIVFRKFYWKPTFERWRRKTNPEYPEPVMVRREILKFAKGIGIATLPPAISLALIDSGWSKAYCGLGDYGWGYLIVTFFVVWIGSDFVEFYYHRLGHVLTSAWKIHKPHHAFHNPSPFAVIADDLPDQFARALPMLLFPLVMPVNIDMLFFTFALFFYAYGVYLHWGHELPWPDAHNRWINTSFQHYLHHSKSTLNKPYHTGFFFKIWDDLYGSNDYGEDRDCLCVRCSTERGERTREAFDRIVKPDYSELLRPSFWRDGRRPPPGEGLRAS